MMMMIKVTAETASLTWDRGTRAQAASDCEAGAGEPHPPGPGGGLDLSEIQKIRTELGNYQTVDIELANLMIVKSLINAFIKEELTFICQSV